MTKVAEHHVDCQELMEVKRVGDAAFRVMRFHSLSAHGV
jgi:hypothetical protein